MDQWSPRQNLTDCQEFFRLKRCPRFDHPKENHFTVSFIKITTILGSIIEGRDFVATFGENNTPINAGSQPSLVISFCDFFKPTVLCYLCQAQGGIQEGGRDLD